MKTINVSKLSKQDNQKKKNSKCQYELKAKITQVPFTQAINLVVFVTATFCQIDRIGWVVSEPVLQRIV
jgi:hypothetical protein